MEKKIILVGILIASGSLLLAPSGASASSLSFSPVAASYAVGQVFPIQVTVSTEANAPINAVSASVSYPADRLALVSIAKAGVITFWPAEPSYSNRAGTADIEGIILNPGFAGRNGVVATLNFRAKTEGAATLSFGKASVLANDGQGTETLQDRGSAAFSLSAAPPSAPASAPAPKTTLSVPVPSVEPAAPTAPATTQPAAPAVRSLTSYAVLPLSVSTLAFLCLLIVAAVRETRSSRAYVRSRIVRAEKDLHRTFKQLHHDLEDYVEIIESASRQKRLSREEELLKRRIKESLEAAERSIARKIEEIG